MGEGVSFIHLSDIHFRKYSGDKFDIDYDLRNEIIRDISKNAKTCLKNIKGVLVCGDIAFSGQESEYEKAQEFLKQICNSLSISETAIYCVPGNHDVDQSVAYRGSVLYSLQSELEKANESNAIDVKLCGYFRDTYSNDALFKHIETYNTKFAGKYGCNINNEKPNWQVDFMLNNNKKLRVYGLNSVVVSNLNDHKDKLKAKPMIIGKYQVPKNEDGVVYMSLCHHPPECWKDPNDNIQKLINKRISIQLYGHKHIQEIKQTDKSLIIGSGATHPSRLEDDWKPRYNWINIKVDKKECCEYLNIKIYQRVLSVDGDKFIADIDEFKEYLIKLENEDINNISKEEYDENVNDKINIGSENEDVLVKRINIDTKTIVYKFLELPYVIQMSILSNYNLLDEYDQGKKLINIIDKIIEKAKQSKCLDEIWKDINEYFK